MPLLLSLGQHPASEAVNRQLRAGELLFAFLDDVYVVCSPARVGVIHTLLENALWGHACIQVHAGKTKVWNRAGMRPEACDFLERRAQLVVERQVWRGGDEAGTAEQGIKMKDAASLPLAFGGMGLRSAVPACWASWRDALSMISQRHRAVATTIVREMFGHSTSTHLNAAVRSADQLRG